MTRHDDAPAFLPDDDADRAHNAIHEMTVAALAADPVLTDADDDTLGPCGCTDYHLADCPLRSLRPSESSRDAWLLRMAAPDFDPYYDADDR